MENSTRFDLETALHNWRRNIEGSPSIRREDLDELETHLRDSVERLQASGLSAEEAFWVAKSRLGAGEILSDEFGKVNRERIWLGRALWMVVGTVGISSTLSLVWMIARLTTIVFLQFTENVTLLGIGAFIVSAVLLCLLLLAAGIGARRELPRVRRAFRWMGSHAAVAALIVFAVSQLAQLGSWAASSLLYRGLHPSTVGALAIWQMLSGILPTLLLPLLLAWLLHKRFRAAHATS